MSSREKSGARRQGEICGGLEPAFQSQAASPRDALNRFDQPRLIIGLRVGAVARNGLAGCGPRYHWRLRATAAIFGVR